MAAFIAERGALGTDLLEQFGDDMEQAETALQDLVCIGGEDDFEFSLICRQESEFAE